MRQLDQATRPVRLRKDLWRPLVAVTGFQSAQSVQAVSDALLQRSQARQLEFKTSPDHLARPKKQRVVDEADLLEKSVVSLREALESVAARHGENKLNALWEQTRFVEQQSWPAFVQHGLLELKNNRFINVSTPSPPPSSPSASSSS